MAVDQLADDGETDIPRAPTGPPLRNRRWIIAIVALAFFAAGLGYVTGNEVQANTQFDQGHASLNVTRHHISVVLGDLATVRHDLDVVNGQVDQDAVALSRDTAQLKKLQADLVNAQSNVSLQSQAISDLQTCLSGVEQALNALAVNDKGRAINALNAVSASCTNAVSANG
jgi:hypothetical protein